MFVLSSIETQESFLKNDARKFFSIILNDLLNILFICIRRANFLMFPNKISDFVQKHVSIETFCSLCASLGEPETSVSLLWNAVAKC